MPTPRPIPMLRMMGTSREAWAESAVSDGWRGGVAVAEGGGEIIIPVVRNVACRIDVPGKGKLEEEPALVGDGFGRN